MLVWKASRQAKMRECRTVRRHNVKPTLRDNSASQGKRYYYSNFNWGGGFNIAGWYLSVPMCILSTLAVSDFGVFGYDFVELDDLR